MVSSCGLIVHLIRIQMELKQISGYVWCAEFHVKARAFFISQGNWLLVFIGWLCDNNLGY